MLLNGRRRPSLIKERRAAKTSRMCSQRHRWPTLRVWTARAPERAKSAQTAINQARVYRRGKSRVICHWLCEGFSDGAHVRRDRRQTSLRGWIARILFILTAGIAGGKCVCCKLAFVLKKTESSGNKNSCLWHNIRFNCCCWISRWMSRRRCLIYSRA